MRCGELNAAISRAALRAERPLALHLPLQVPPSHVPTFLGAVMSFCKVTGITVAEWLRAEGISPVCMSWGGMSFRSGTSRQQCSARCRHPCSAAGAQPGRVALSHTLSSHSHRRGVPFHLPLPSRKTKRCCSHLLLHAILSQLPLNSSHSGRGQRHAHISLYHFPIPWEQCLPWGQVRAYFCSL